MERFITQNWLPGKQLFAFRGSKILCGTVYKTVFEQQSDDDVRIEYHLEDERGKDLGYILEKDLVETKEDAIKQYEAKMNDEEFIPEIQSEKVEVKFTYGYNVYCLDEDGTIRNAKIDAVKIVLDNSQEDEKEQKVVEFGVETNDYYLPENSYFESKEQAIKHFVKCLEKTPVNRTVEINCYY